MAAASEKDRGASLSCFVLRCRSAYNSEGTLATPGIVSVMSVSLDFSEICAYVISAASVFHERPPPCVEEYARVGGRDPGR